MLEKIGSFFRKHMVPRGTDDAAESLELRRAACALLLELAYADDAFTPEEHEHLEKAIRRQFGLGHEEAEELLLMADWQRRMQGDVGPFARLIGEHYSTGQKMVLVEIMWGLLQSDGARAPAEEEFMVRINALLGLESGYLDADRRHPRAVDGSDRFD